MINYNLGKDLVKQYVESRGGIATQPAKRWDEFVRLLASPRLPSGLRADDAVADPLRPERRAARATFGEIDIYLFDQLLRGRFDRRPRVLDAGCGDGRNLVYFLRRGFACFGVDRDPAAIAQVRALAAQLAPQLPAENFRAGELDRLPWDAASDGRRRLQRGPAFCAATSTHFDRMVDGDVARARAGRPVLRAAGVEHRPRGRGRRRRAGACGCPTAPIASSSTKRCCSSGPSGWAAQLLDPIKTTNVQQQRCMTTWCRGKRSDASARSPCEVRRQSPSSSPTPLKSST